MQAIEDPAHGLRRDQATQNEFPAGSARKLPAPNDEFILVFQPAAHVQPRREKYFSFVFTEIGL
jgi:hypothetical protein